MLSDRWRADLPISERTGTVQQQVSMDQFGDNYCHSGVLFLYRWQHNYDAAGFRAMLVYALGRTRERILSNPFTKFISAISMEIYLSHMVIFRVVERLGLNTMIGNGWVQYAATVVIVLVGTIIFSADMKKILDLLGKKVSRKMA